jgi:hypothetical protein
MSLIPAGLSILSAFTRGLVAAAFFRPRMIGGLIANVTIEEDHVDELEITRHPVEQGASITDHAFKQPSMVRILVGYSNSNFQALGNPNYVQMVYEQFLALQASRVPIVILTGKRRYANMLIRRLHEHTDEKTENAMLLTVECQEIPIATTQTVTVPPAENMQNPQSTAPVVSGGARSLQPGSNYNPAQSLALGIAPI